MRLTAVAGLVCGLLCVPAQAKTIQITVQNLAFIPAQVNANVGDTIEWNNKDVLLHSATAKSGDWDVNLPPQKTGRTVLNKSGSVDYYCKYHPNMTGRIIVAP